MALSEAALAGVDVMRAKEANIPVIAVEFAKNPGIKTLSDNQNGQDSREGGLDAMTHWLTTFPKMEGVEIGY